MRIGELASTTGVSTQALRFYERKGLVPPPARSSNGYRHYAEGVVARVEFVRAAQAVGLTLEQVRGILELRDLGTTPCTHVVGLIEDQLAEVRRRQAELSALETELEHLRERGARLDPAECTDDGICDIVTHGPAPHGGPGRS
ncbi:heavy metal-responsive transcriptional regulator [Isoptericola halotolerans]|uniref:heavy metal-responsive transcriptional regulator n=1 Tax=Isoptericola halotolerans TaxID=300560 RepID=UPI00389105C5